MSASPLRRKRLSRSRLRGPDRVLLAALAAETERVALGPLVASTGFHAPAMLAKAGGDGRRDQRWAAHPGARAGWNETEYTAYGFSFEITGSAGSTRRSRSSGPSSATVRSISRRQGSVAALTG